MGWEKTFEVTERWSPSRRPFAVNLNEVKVGLHREYLKISLPAVTVARKDGKTLFYGGTVGYWDPQHNFKGDPHDLTIEVLAANLKQGTSQVCSLTADGFFSTLGDSVAIKSVLYWTRVLQQAHDFTSIAPAGFTGWIQQAK